MSLAVAAQHEGGDPRVVGREVVGEGVPPPRPEQRHRVQCDDDVDRVVVARGEDEEGLLRARARDGDGDGARDRDGDGARDGDGDGVRARCRRMGMG